MEQPDTARTPVIVVGGSAGAVEAASQLVRGLPHDLAAAVFVVIHFPSDSTSVLPAILARAGQLPAAHVQDGEPIMPGRIYIAPPDQHLLVRPGLMRLSGGPKNNGHRPAVDTLFFSAATAYAGAAIGVILSGTLDDGTAGMASIKRHGGMTLVQSPAEAIFDGMPRSAIEHVAVDYVAPVAQLARLLRDLALAGQKVMPAMKDLSSEDTIFARQVAADRAALEHGEPRQGQAIITCPACGGALWEHDAENIIRFRCHVGHTYSPESLLNAQGEDLEQALWSAVRALEERVMLTRRLSNQMHARGNQRSASQFADRAEDHARSAELIRTLLTGARPAQQSDDQSATG